MAAYKRILLKISGEALEDKENHNNYDPKVLLSVTKTVKQIREMNVELAMVIGGGNIWRGNLASSIGIDKATGDYMGMLATVMNAMAVQSFFEKNGLEARVLSALPINACAEPYIRRRAIRHLEKGRIVIFAGGVGSPFFTTDTGAALRAKEINAEAIFMGKNGVDGVFDDDPKKNKNAKLIPEISFQDVLSQNLRVMDSTAVGLVADSDLKIHVFNMADTDNAIRILNGEKLGSVIFKK